MVETRSNGQRLIFIGGSPRSGTTLLQNMLDSHPLIIGGPEFLHLQDIVDLRRRLHSSITKGWIDIICTREDVDSYIIEIIEKLFLPVADNNQCEFYSEKTPMNILVFSELIELFPESHFIQVIRDPRAIVSSMQQVKKRAIDKGFKPPDFTANLPASIAYVKNCFEAGFKADNNNPGKVLTILYENLISDPERESKKICKILEIEWSDRMLYPGEKEHLGEAAITINSNELWYDADKYYKNVESKHLEKWQINLTLGRKINTMIAFKDDLELKKYGYNFSFDSLTEDSSILAKGYYAYLWLGKVFYRYLSKIVRKIPGIYLVKRGLLATVKLIG